MIGEEDIEAAILFCRSEGDRISAERLADAQASRAVADSAGGVDAADDIGVIVFDRRQAFGEGPGARVIAGDRGVEVEGFVRALAVVDMAPGIEAALAVGIDFIPENGGGPGLRLRARG